MDIPVLPFLSGCVHSLHQSPTFSLWRRRRYPPFCHSFFHPSRSPNGLKKRGLSTIKVDHFRGVPYDGFQVETLSRTPLTLAYDMSNEVHRDSKDNSNLVNRKHRRGRRVDTPKKVVPVVGPDRLSTRYDPPCVTSRPWTRSV